MGSQDSENILISDEGENREALVRAVSEGFCDLFGRDPAVVGRSIRLATGSGTVVGVALAVALFAFFVPAVRASRRAPVEGLTMD